MEAKYTSERLEVFGSEYDGTLYVMPEGAWIGRGGSETFATLPENIHDREEKAAFIVRACNAHDALVEALKALLNHVDRETCVHESTHRGGALWTICDGCGMKWADDRGGFVLYTDPAAVAEARAALAIAGETP
jgi:hypothetical protein